MRKQKLSSVGIHKKSLRQALILGCSFAILPLAINIIIPTVLYDVYVRHISHMSFMLLYLFVMAAMEDIFFVGFLQTRLYGLFKTDRAAISVGAILFSLVHIPVGIASTGMGFIGTQLIMYLVGLFFMHQMLVLLFRKFFSFATIVVVHTIFNWSYIAIWQWTPETAEYAVFWSSIAGFVLIVAVNIWDWKFNHRTDGANQSNA
jgi:hypothetical protein